MAGARGNEGKHAKGWGQGKFDRVQGVELRKRWGRPHRFSVVGHGQFLGWTDAEFGMSERFGKSANFADLEISQSALYLLAAPSTEDAVVAEATVLGAQLGQDRPDPSAFLVDFAYRLAPGAGG